MAKKVKSPKSVETLTHGKAKRKNLPFSAEPHPIERFAVRLKSELKKMLVPPRILVSKFHPDVHHGKRD
jgi:hypothetical protein